MDDIFDAGLKCLMGDRYEDGEPKPVRERKGKPPVAQYETVEETEATEEQTTNLWDMVKFPLLFMALVAFLGWTANMELVDPIVAIPGMCLCSACFGWTMKRGDK